MRPLLLRCADCGHPAPTLDGYQRCADCRAKIAAERAWWLGLDTYGGDAPHTLDELRRDARRIKYGR